MSDVCAQRWGVAVCAASKLALLLLLNLAIVNPRNAPWNSESCKALNATDVSMAADLGRPAFISVARQTWMRWMALRCW